MFRVGLPNFQHVGLGFVFVEGFGSVLPLGLGFDRVRNEIKVSFRVRVTIRFQVWLRLWIPTKT